MGKAAYRGGKMGKMGKHRGKGGKAAMRVVDIDIWMERAHRSRHPPAAPQGGVTRTNADIYEEARDVTKAFLTMILKDAITYTDHACRKTITAVDIKYSLDRNKIEYYACGTDKKPKKAAGS